ncbi:MAG: transglutaminase domain-containing protein [Saccharofermentanales bacterium]
MQKSISRKIASLSIFIIFIITFLSYPSVKSYAAIPAFSNAATIESDVRALFQTSFDNMASSVEFKIDGVAASKKFFQSDQAGNIISEPGFSTTPLFQTLFEKQLIDMKPGNYNAYTRFALQSYVIDIDPINYSESSPGIINSITSTVKYTLKWHDGAYPLSGRNDVINHAKAFLNSPEYTTKTTEYGQLKAINKYICDTFQYDYRLFVEGPTAVIYTAYNMINDFDAIGGYKRGVCQAYSMYGYIMLKEAGFNAITVEGTAGGGAHAWNMAQVGANWYHIDFTWDDPISVNNPLPYVKRQKGAGNSSENYLLRSDAEISINHAWTKIQSGYTYPLSTSKWNGTPTIIDITQPPVPTSTKAPTPTKIAVPTLTPTRKITSAVSSRIASSSQGSSQGSSSAVSAQASVSPTIAATAAITQNTGIPSGAGQVTTSAESGNQSSAPSLLSGLTPVNILFAGAVIIGLLIIILLIIIKNRRTF